MRIDKSLKSIITSVPEKAGDLSSKMGRGLMAGFIGTGIMTLAQVIEMKITKREASHVPVESLENIFDVKVSEEKNERLNYAIHFLYGTGLGKIRAIISSLGLKSLPATLLHFGIVWVGALVMLPKLKLTPSVKEWGAKALTIDALEHMVYAVAVGLIYDSMDEAFI